MENISKSLILAGTLLISVLTLAVIIALFRSGGDLGNTYQSRREQEAIRSYNEPFTKLSAISDEFDDSGNVTKMGKITIYDVISAINYAKDINQEYIDEGYSYDANDTRSDYIKINLYDNQNCITILKSLKNNSIKYEDVAGENFSQSDFHDLIKDYPSDKIIWGISISGYNSDGKINDVKFYLRN